MIFVSNLCQNNPVYGAPYPRSPLGKFADCVPCSVGIRQFVRDARGIHISGTVSPTGRDHPPGHGSPTSASIMVITILGYKHVDSGIVMYPYIYPSKYGISSWRINYVNIYRWWCKNVWWLFISKKDNRGLNHVASICLQMACLSVDSSVFCYGLMQVNFTNLLQGHFNCTGAIFKALICHIWTNFLEFYSDT